MPGAAESCRLADPSVRVRLSSSLSTNIFLSFYGEILLGDLGLSRQLKGDIGLTKVGTQVGTPPYMSPELVSGHEYGTSSDVWAIGVVLFEMLALRRPFDVPLTLQASSTAPQAYSSSPLLTSALIL